MVDTLDAALDALKRELFYTQMAEAEDRLRSRPAEWDEFTAERAQWLDAPLDAQ